MLMLNPNSTKILIPIPKTWPLPLPVFTHFDPHLSLLPKFCHHTKIVDLIPSLPSPIAPVIKYAFLGFGILSMIFLRNFSKNDCLFWEKVGNHIENQANPSRIMSKCKQTHRKTMPEIMKMHRDPARGPSRILAPAGWEIRESRNHKIHVKLCTLVSGLARAGPSPPRKAPEDPPFSRPPELAHKIWKAP